MKTLTLSCVALSLASFAGAQTVTSVTPSNPTRSGLVRIAGTGLGTDGTIVVFGREAPIARWTDSLIEFYVPEETPIGNVKVLVNQPTARKTIFSVSVQDRPAVTGRIQWRFQAADQYIITRPAIGPDGTVYALGNFGHLYAIAPNGAIKWVFSGGVAGTVDVGTDGTIYCGGAGGIQAFAPNGTRLWTYPLNSALMAGPNVGPDGNIYVADNARWNANPTGLAVVSPSGQTVWIGDRYYGRGGVRQTDVVFDNLRAYIWSAGDNPTNTQGGLHATRLGGELDWINPDIVGFLPGAYETGGVVAQGTSTTQRMSSNGSNVWTFDLWSIGGYQPRGDVIASPDGGAYFFTSNTKLNALSPGGALRFSTTIGGIVDNLTLSPDASYLAFSKAENNGLPYHIEAYNINGTLRWRSEDLPMELGTAITPYIRMKFTPSGDALYFGTAGPMTSQDTANCYVYKLDPR